jgi:hypothetical protein
MRTGREARLPEDVRRALEELLGPGVADVRVIEYSWFVRLHGPALATTRVRRIYLRGSAAEFFADPWLMLHEYCHVIHQWETGTLTTLRYLIELMRRGYWDNRFEVEARDFATRHAASLHARLGLPPPRGIRLSLG